MSRPLRLLVLLLCLVSTAGTYLAAVGAPGSGAGQAGEWPTLPYQNEDEWIVSQTARAVIDLARLVESGTPAPIGDIALTDVTRDPDPANPGRFALQIGPRPATVRVNTYVWDPDVYLPLARTAGVVERESAPADTDGVVAALVNLTAATLEAQNHKISAALAADLRNPSHHEAAAFLLTALALREASGDFYDPRLVLSRASAHLAVARALRSATAQPSLAGRLADITLLVVSGRMGPAIRRMDMLAAGSPPEPAQTWMRALRCRATLDWRVAPGDGASLVERLEYVRALTRMTTASAVLDYLAARKPVEAADWAWRGLEYRMTIESGHAFVKTTFAQTFVEAVAILNPHVPIDSHATLITALGVAPAVSSVDRSAVSNRRVRVIDAGLWAEFYQRHLAHIAARGTHFYRDLYASKEAADGFEIAIDRAVGDVRVWPIVRQLRTRTPGEYAAAMPRVTRLLRERPDAVASVAWHAAVQWVPKDATRIPAPRPSGWFRTVFPSGTTFDADRLQARGRNLTDVRTQIDALHQLSPWDPGLTGRWSEVQCALGCTPEQERGHYAAIEDYHLPTMRKFAYASADPAASLRRLCDVSGDDCYQLPEWLLSRDRLVEAADAYQTYARVARDLVGVSNRMEWLVRYYQRAGRTADARRIAELAGESGSARGLKTLAGFHERAGDPVRALALYRDIRDRYEHHDTALLAFYMRRLDATGRKPEDPEYTRLLNRYFGGELLAPDPQDAAPPVQGLRVTRTNLLNEKAGVRAGDIVTAVDDVQVWTTEQYQVVYERSFDKPMRLIVWRTGRYVTIEAPFRQYHSGVDLEPFRSPATHPLDVARRNR